jgi:hypothetical protein
LLGLETDRDGGKILRSPRSWGATFSNIWIWGAIFSRSGRISLPLRSLLFDYSPSMIVCFSKNLTASPVDMCWWWLIFLLACACLRCLLLACSICSLRVIFFLEQYRL